MSRYIDADKMKSELLLGIEVSKTILPPSIYNDTTQVIRYFIKLLDEFETADVVDRARYKQLLENSTIMADALKEYENEDVIEVVRCKDCECHDTHDHRCKSFNHGVAVNDYCSRAIERSEDE